MIKRLGNVLAVAAFAVAAAGASPAFATEPTGLWYDHTGRGAVEIVKCGNLLCGRVVWIKDGVDRRACGIQILGNIKPMPDGTWEGGWIYDPERDAKFSVELTPVGAKSLKVLGYMGTKFFSETMMWQRAPADLKRC
jgi:uncharacterized protein (DUF2147 family)